jgi:hypothetical protein
LSSLTTNLGVQGDSILLIDSSDDDFLLPTPIRRKRAIATIDEDAEDDVSPPVKKPSNATKKAASSTKQTPRPVKKTSGPATSAHPDTSPKSSTPPRRSTAGQEVPSAQQVAATQEASGPKTATLQTVNIREPSSCRLGLEPIPKYFEWNDADIQTEIAKFGFEKMGRSLAITTLEQIWHQDEPPKVNKPSPASQQKLIEHLWRQLRDLKKQVYSGSAAPDPAMTTSTASPQTEGHSLTTEQRQAVELEAAYKEIETLRLDKAKLKDALLGLIG